MKTLMKLSVLVFMFLTSSIAMAHGGGLDKNGCHRDHKNGDYHCHR